MAEYKSSQAYNVPFLLLTPTYQKISGVEKKSYLNDGVLFFGTFKTYGGTERNFNDVYSIEDTGIVETWYRPDIKSDCAVEIAETGARYEIIGEPENINMRNQRLSFKVRRIKGGA